MKRVAKIIPEKSIFEILEEKHGKSYVLKKCGSFAIIVFLFLVCEIATKIELLGKDITLIVNILLLFLLFLNLSNLFNFALNEVQLVFEKKRITS